MPCVSPASAPTRRRPSPRAREESAWVTHLFPRASAGTMKSIHVRAPGGPEVLSLVERPVPVPGPGEVLIRVAAAAVNRPDVQQRRGLYPPPPGASDVLGLDVAGVVDRVGPDVSWPQPGEAVCALANGGGYAEFCSVPAVQCLPIPKGFGFVAAASLPEAFFTAWNSMIWLGRLGHNE